MWGINYFRFLPAWFLVVYALAGAAALWGILGRRDDLSIIANASEYFDRKPYHVLGGTIVGTAVVAILFHIRIPLLGDSFILINDFENTFQGLHTLHTGREPLSLYFFFTIFSLAGAHRYEDMTGWFLVSEIFLAVVFIVAVYFIVRNVTDRKETRLLLFASAIIMPYVQLFFGYVEIYSFSLALIALYVLAGILYLNGRTFLIVPLIAAAVMVCAHFLSAVFVFSATYLLIVEFRRNGLKNVLLMPGIIIFVLAAIVVLFHIQIRDYFPDNPESHLLTISPSSDPYQAYTLFSPFHASDLCNLILLISPFGPLLVLLILQKGFRAFSASPILQFLALGSAGYLLFLLAAKFDLGTATDWDVSAPYFFVINLLLVMMYLFQFETGDHAALIMIVFIALQTAPWFYLNSTRKENFDRIESVMDRRILSQQGRYQSIMHFSFMLIHEGDSVSVPSLWKNYTREYPRDWTGYQNLAYTTACYLDQKSPQVDSSYEKAIALDPLHQSKQQYTNHCNDVSLLYFQKGDTISAERYLLKAIKLQPDFAGAYNNLGLLYEVWGRDSLAAAHFLKAVAIDPHFAMSMVNLGDLYLHRGNAQQALAGYQKAFAMQPSPEISEKIAEAYNDMGKTDSVVAWLQRAARAGSATAARMLTKKGIKWW